jgi:ABC-2 type transport system permease protein
MHYIRLINIFIRKSLQKEMAFRFNFFINILNTFLQLAGGLAGVFALFANVDSLNGWNFPQVLAVLGVYMLVDAMKELFIGPGLQSIAGMDGDLWSGRFDFTLLKPVPVQFYVSFREWNPWAVVDITAAFVLLGVAGIKHGQGVTVPALGMFLGSLVISLLLVYSVMLLLISGAFWYLGAPLVWIYDSIIQMGRFPVSIYPGFLKLLLTWIVPVGFIVTVPAESLSSGIGTLELAGGGLLALGLFAAASVVFKTGLRRYSSASG